MDENRKHKIGEVIMGSIDDVSYKHHTFRIGQKTFSMPEDKHPPLMKGQFVKEGTIDRVTEEGSLAWLKDVTVLNKRASEDILFTF